MTCQTTRGPGRTNLGKDLTPAQGAPQQGTTESNENRRGRTTTREAQQGDRHTSENRSRSPVNKEKDPVIILGSQEPSSDAPPNNPDAAMTKGWKNEDFGGVGDCLFRAVGAYLEYAEGAKSVNNKKAITRGALLRKDSVHYIRRHTDRFKIISTLKQMARDPKPLKLGYLNVVNKKPLPMESSSRGWLKS